MSNFSADDYQYMALALQLAEQGRYSTSPNPKVGCVIVKHGQVIGQGAHLKAGEPHAEVFALRQAGERAQQATLYVTLEPCSHTGRTPPCADTVISSGVTRVVVAMQDPNPMVAGSGLKKLAAHGIVVESGLLEAQALALNAGFVMRMTQQRPFVRSKLAASLDGKTALNNGASQWITSEAARLDVQHWRASACAILTGVGTILADNPRLNVRMIDTPRQPLRVVVDTHLRTPADANILQTGQTLIAYVDDPTNAAPALMHAGAQLLQLPTHDHKVCLNSLLKALAQRGINELMCESGAGLNGALLAQGLVDELLMYIAPCLLGDSARGMFALPVLNRMDARIQLQLIDVRQVGADMRIRAKPICS
jgi:diaminohydroxyphosphoribosylaminopyrimidine deaminase / 5-amino-6-(5-phosphoribosylamino)uracil reductase